MARNFKKDYIAKLAKYDVNGFKVDLYNYLHNVSYAYDYPTFIKLISDDGASKVYCRVSYFKHYDGTGIYRVDTFRLTDIDGNFSQRYDINKLIVEESNRFSLNKLVSICEGL